MSSYPGPVAIGAGGPSNFFAPGANDRGQPGTFLPGRHDQVVRVSFPASSLVT